MCEEPPSKTDREIQAIERGQKFLDNSCLTPEQKVRVLDYLKKRAEGQLLSPNKHYTVR